MPIPGNLKLHAGRVIIRKPARNNPIKLLIASTFVFATTDYVDRRYYSVASLNRAPNGQLAIMMALNNHLDLEKSRLFAKPIIKL